ncbi:2154_t:CDS:2 [Acaulospora colombiana]|uniref:2154_t:CDS:1 n=1 Tax=Acaulospora colombiana TaxID=27376 RepID=A0ACA9N9P8_9GLOM|nr:2154_t:CDS:2 [Acaulospora colombiana]
MDTDVAIICGQLRGTPRVLCITHQKPTQKLQVGNERLGFWKGRSCVLSIQTWAYPALAETNEGRHTLLTSLINKLRVFKAIQHHRPFLFPECKSGNWSLRTNQSKLTRLMYYTSYNALHRECATQ